MHTQRLAAKAVRLTKSVVLLLREKLIAISESLKQIPSYATTTWRGFRKHLNLLYSKGWGYLYKAKSAFTTKIKAASALTLLIIISGLTLKYKATLFNSLAEYFSTPERFEDLKTTVGILGGSMIGAAAIAFSLVMFAMQINVERMPHGLFRKFSTDFRLLCAFAVTFVIAVSITALTLIPDGSWSIFAVLYTGLGITSILVLFIYAYRRALDLVSPTKQLEIVVESSRKNLKAWGKAATRLSPLLDANNRTDAEDNNHDRKHDSSRAAYFTINQNWTQKAERNIEYCIAYAKRYADQNDHEVSRVALHAVIAINAAYIKAKQDTFFSRNYLFDTPWANDPFITNTLEQIRKNVSFALSNKDEQQIILNFSALHQLCCLYLNINYSRLNPAKHHAHLAAGYLSRAVESVVPHDLTDVIIEGLRLMGRSAIFITQNDSPLHTATITEKIGAIAIVPPLRGTYNRDFPIAQTAVYQLSEITFHIIVSGTRDIRHSIEEIRGNLKLMVNAWLSMPDSASISYHSVIFKGYYSGTASDSLIQKLTTLTNQISDAPSDDTEAKRIIRNIRKWSEDLYDFEKSILLSAIEKKSFLAFDVIHWVAHITKLLLATSKSDACDEHEVDELQRNAKWLISVLSFVPDDPDSVHKAESYNMTETLFDVLWDSYNRKCTEVVGVIRQLIIDWAFMAGKYKGWGILENAICGLTAFNIMFGLNDTVIISDIDKKVSRGAIPDLNFRFRVAENIRERAQQVHGIRADASNIETLMAHVDAEHLESVLKKAADHLCPELNEEGRQ